jgi:hypothetical protein
MAGDEFTHEEAARLVDDMDEFAHGARRAGLDDIGDIVARVGAEEEAGKAAEAEAEKDDRRQAFHRLADRLGEEAS